MRIALLESVRRNHAIEHATVTLLLERGVPAPMGGYSIGPGFVVWSRGSIDDVALAAQDALDLLKAGNSELAISPYCGTNIVTFALVGALAAKDFLGSQEEFLVGRPWLGRCGHRRDPPGKAAGKAAAAPLHYPTVCGGGNFGRNSGTLQKTGVCSLDSHGQS